MVLPWIADASAPRRQAAIAVVAGLSAIVLLLFAVPEPWSGLTLSSATLGTWDQYLPIAGRLVHGNLFIP
jgi:hypothetical protein